MDDKYIVGCIIIVVLFFTCQLGQAQNYGDFPYSQSFRTETQPEEIDIVTPQNSQIQNDATFTSEGLRLTSNETGRFGAVFIGDHQFQSIQGIRIEFEYLMYGGSGADGMCVFFFDAGINNPVIGSIGSALGYTYNRTNSYYAVNRATGLSGAYLGIALDSYGNFKNRFWQGDSRINGIPDISGDLGDRYISNVTLRGARGGATQVADFASIAGMDDGYMGYPVLISQPTLNNNEGWQLNGIGGYSSINTYRGDFNLRGEDQSDYRRAIIEIYPLDSNEGFEISVTIQHGETETIVINDYPYRRFVEYAENAYDLEGDNIIGGSVYPESTPTILDATIPMYLRIGFAASTGGETDIHLLRELKISLPSSAEAYDDYASTTRMEPVVIDVLDNDIGYSGQITKTQIGDKEHLNPNSFRFCDDSGEFLGVVVDDMTVYDTAEGNWLFNFQEGKLTFTSARDFIGLAAVRYSIKSKDEIGEPYDDEAYRSPPAVVNVNVSTFQTIISNRMVTPLVN
ncbi:L-type lectin family protein [Dysgonomonas termitidis]|uniref:Uncharacterized protein n=1 Tax=Dysgonomonas termitidis TaxID=1516126 RepID=A0ABV9KQH1_9BACT